LASVAALQARFTDPELGAVAVNVGVVGAVWSTVHVTTAGVRSVPSDVLACTENV
jgi:hypothetical protein